MVEDFNSKLKEDGGKSLVGMEEKVKMAEVKLRVVEEEWSMMTMIINTDMIMMITTTMILSKVKLREVEAESQAKEADMHKVYDLVNRWHD